jgi:hypothetical protein
VVLLRSSNRFAFAEGKGWRLACNPLLVGGCTSSRRTVCALACQQEGRFKHTLQDASIRGGDRSGRSPALSKQLCKQVQLPGMQHHETNSSVDRCCMLLLQAKAHSVMVVTAQTTTSRCQ